MANVRMGFFKSFAATGADEGTIKPTLRRKPSGARHSSPLFDAGNELIMDVFTDSLEVIVANFFDFGDVAVAGEFAVLIVVAPVGTA